jgi:type III restriction enzyme
VVNAFLAHVEITQKSRDPYTVGPQLARPDGFVTFKNALHEGYYGLNSLELTFAQALDKQGIPWARNPSRTGYHPASNDRADGVLLFRLHHLVR